MRNTFQSLRTVLVVCLLAAACSSPPETVTVMVDDAPDAMAFEVATPVDNARESAPMSTVAVVDAQRCGGDWEAVVSPVFAAANGSPADISTSALGEGCLSQTVTSGGAMSILLEPISARAVEELIAEREPADSFMGFLELEFLTTDVWASSSLLHADLDRLVETRWLILDAENGVRLEVTVDGDAAAARARLLEQIDVLEATAAAYQVAGNADRLVTENAWGSNGHAVEASAALIVILDHVANTERLGPIATEDGADAIAFEYAFPENFAALRSAHRPTDCSANSATARCILRSGASMYAFDFVRGEGAWLLDDFALLDDAGQ